MILELLDTVPLAFEGGPADAGEYLLSPFVYAQGRAIAIRAVPHLDNEPERKISRIFRGDSSDGRRFALDGAPMLAPSEAADSGGVEDPTVVEDGPLLHVFYSGWDTLAKRSTLLRADGPPAGPWVKRGPVLHGPHVPQAKEATLLQRDGGWTMFFETEDGASLNATATSPALAGPWTSGDDVLRPRRGFFDSANVSPVAFIRSPTGARILIYNGANADARWEIGWCMLDESCSRVLDRCDEPVVRAARNAPEQRELVFAASVIERGDLLDVYYSVGDTDPMRATLRWRHGA